MRIQDRNNEVSALWCVADDAGGVIRELVRPTKPDLPILPGSGNIVGAGRSHLFAAWASAVSGADASFVRVRPKGHGTGRRREGRWVADAGDVALYSTAEERRCLDDVVPSAAFVRIAPSGDDGVAYPRRLPVSRPAYDVVEDPSACVEVLEGKVYVRSSGERATFYFDTLPAAHTYAVAATFADALMAGREAPEATVGVAWGGIYLAAVIAARYGTRLLSFDPDREDAGCRWSSPPDGVLFVDDLVNSGSDLRRCEMFAHTSGVASARFAALFALGDPPASLESHPVEVHSALTRSPAVSSRDPKE